MSNGYKVQQLYGEGYKYKAPTYSYEQVKALKHLASLGEDVRKKQIFGYGIAHSHGAWSAELEPLNSVPFEDIIYSLTTGEYAYQPTYEDYLTEQLEYWKRTKKDAPSIMTGDLATRAIEVLTEALMMYRQLNQVNKEGE
ncbi:hypothetical protein F373_gp230 [Bacillus phage SP-10]|uniref:hypothetical protein n=1 Tax=Bacillus phage SP10 TaxID=941058 RepID=UPI0002198BBA|nr:hypothetical protein F373_gp230 [Bacillus phage SP-10]BAK53042.1 hypothetical protein [Bacillus phage SP-10]